MANTIFHAADSRGHANHGWLNAKHSFSFAGFHDPEKIQFGALRVLNDDIVAPGMGFGKHPHDNMEIITIVLDGALEHKDSMGHTQAILPNEVQVMSAGTGVFHSEYNHHKDQPVNLLQTWIFPNKKNVKPRYDQRVFSPGERVNTWQAIVSPEGKDDGGIKIYQDAWIYRATIEAGKSMTHTLHNSSSGVYAFLIDGEVQSGKQQLKKRDAVGITGVEEVSFTAQTTSDVLLFEVPMEW